MVGLAMNEHGGGLVTKGKDGKSRAVVGHNEHGAGVVVSGKDEHSEVVLGLDEDGGRAYVKGKDGKHKIDLAVSQNGDGIVRTLDKHESPLTLGGMDADEHNSMQE